MIQSQYSIWPPSSHLCHCLWLCSSANISPTQSFWQLVYIHFYLHTASKHACNDVMPMFHQNWSLHGSQLIVISGKPVTKVKEGEGAACTYLHTARIASAHCENDLPRLSMTWGVLLLNQHCKILLFFNWINYSWVKKHTFNMQFKLHAVEKVHYKSEYTNKLVHSPPDSINCVMEAVSWHWTGEDTTWSAIEVMDHWSHKTGPNKVAAKLSLRGHKGSTETLFWTQQAGRNRGMAWMNHLAGPDKIVGYNSTETLFCKKV